MKARLTELGNKLRNGLRNVVVGATIGLGPVKQPAVKEPTRQFDK